jgi:hypothetical protein
MGVSLNANDLQLEQKEKPATFRRGFGESQSLPHEQHLAGALDGAVERALIVGGQPGVLAGKNTALIRDELAEQIHILVIQRIDGEIDLGLRTRGAFLHPGAFATAFAVFFEIGLTGHKKII